ncbi:MAG: hypothetical protein ACKVW3_09160 [Phycisphaerales bacterium]
MKDQYFFGRTLARQIDFFAFPRTGSHFLRYCTQGLFDLVALPQPGTDEPEAVDRQRELQPLALYALDLREDGVPLSPVWFNARAAGRHGTPAKADAPALILIREPIATVYSFYRAATSRWGTTIDAPAAWLQDKFNRYTDFYRAGLAITAEHPQHSLLLRFEDLVESPAALERLVAFVGVRPKLAPAFVHAATRFDAMVAPGARSFYRAGDNTAWRADPDFCRILERVQLPDSSEFGYPAWTRS